MCTVVLCVNVSLYHVFVPYNLTVPSVQGKIFRESIEGHNVVFFGDSRVRHQIIPHLFDEHVKDVASIQTYTFGIPSMGFLEEYYLYENFLEKVKVKPEYAFLNIGLRPIGMVEREVIRERYWVDTKRLYYSLRFFYMSPDRQDKLESVIGVTKHYIQRISNMGVWRAVVQHAETQEYSKYRGYEPLYSDPKKLSEYRRGVHLAYRMGNGYELKIKNIESGLQTDCSMQNIEAYADMLERYIKLSKQHGVYPIFFLSAPGMGEVQYCALVSLPAKHKVGYPSPNEFPGLYKRENFYDKFHFNEIGAELYTKYVADEFKRILQTEALNEF